MLPCQLQCKHLLSINSLASYHHAYYIMGYIPPSSYPLGRNPSLDILLLLMWAPFGVDWSPLRPFYARKSSSLRQQKYAFQQLQHLTKQNRRKSSAFVNWNIDFSRRKGSPRPNLSRSPRRNCCVKSSSGNYRFGLSFVVFLCVLQFPDRLWMKLD
jgi:hypothetical protein